MFLANQAKEATKVLEHKSLLDETLLWVRLKSNIPIPNQVPTSQDTFIDRRYVSFQAPLSGYLSFVTALGIAPS